VNYLLLVSTILFLMVTTSNAKSSSVRIPPEWEPQKATWMQWPRVDEEHLIYNFSGIIDVLQDYEPIHILVTNASARFAAQNFLVSEGVSITNITWHIMDYNWCWMRDNGPIWVAENYKLSVQNWKFNGWGEPDTPFAADDAVPPQVAALTGLSCTNYDFFNEKGNLEFNGAGALITSWVCLSNRNPGVTMTEMESLFETSFGVTQVVWLLSGPSDDITDGHVDSIARFIDEETVAVARYSNQSDPNAYVFEEAASIISNAGFEVVRLDVPGSVGYLGEQLPCIYLNWLVANGVVIVPGFDYPLWDNTAKAIIESYFPNRDVIIVEMLDLWYDGGGIHCVTNDQPDDNFIPEPCLFIIYNLLVVIYYWRRK
jgi:agmatine deiminase